jgi:hypothetical protein
VLAGGDHRVDRLVVPVRLRLVGDQIDPDRGRLLRLAGLDEKLRQPQPHVPVGRGGLFELPLVLEGVGDVALVLRQLRQLPEELRVPGVFGKEALELLAGRTQVPGRLVGLGDAQGHFPLLIRLAPLALQPLQQLVELVVLQVQLRQPSDHAGLAL